MKTKTLIGLALLVAAIHGGGCGKEPFIGGDIDELALKETPWHVADARAAVSNGVYPSMSAAYGETLAGPRRQSEAATPLKSNSLTAWWKKLWAKIKAAIDPPDDPVTPPVVDPPPVTPPVTPPVEAGVNTFLWKQTSETRGGRCAVITPANMNVKKVTINGVNHTLEYAGRANGNRQHFFQDAAGAAYGHNVSVKAYAESGALLREWIVPDGGQRKEF